ncbi:MAG TPA: 50S ribosomal protein L9 [Oceanipulchritudo sp.]|nr:50S ribosomal protein L9 [Oceanipulchritudo sp.]
MAHAQLLLIKPVENLGNEGDTITVKTGYARNYLLPHGLAIPVTRSNRKQIESLRDRAEKRKASELENAQSTAAKLETFQIVFAVQTGPGGKMFGSVTAQDLVSRIAENGVQLDKKQVSLYTPVKSLGKHTTRVRLHPEVSIDFEFEVVSENPIEEEAAQAE